MSESNGSNGRDDKGKFVVGNPGKPKGAMTNASAKVKQVVFDFLEKNVESIQESYDTLKPIEKLQFIANILPYALPKLSSVQSENNHKLNGGLTIRWINPRDHASLRPARYEGNERESLGFRGGVSDNSEPRGDEIG